MALRIASATSEAALINTALPRASFTIMAWYYPITLSGWRNIFYFLNAGGSEVVAVQTNGTTLYGADVSGSTIAANNWHHITLVHNSGTNSLVYLNGILDITDPGDLVGGTWDYAQIGRWSASLDYMDGRIAIVKIWSAALAANEILQEMKVIRPVRTADLFSWHPTFPGATERVSDWSGNGYALTEVNTLTDEDPPPISWGAPPRFFSITAAGLTHRTLTAEAGSYAMTGNAATLKVGRKVSADAGAYTYTGNAAALKYGYKLSLDAGTYTYTGQDATAKLTRKLALDAGAYTYTGQDATPKAGRKLSLDAGSYAITGQDASTKYGRTISADAGTYTYTGNAASLLAGRKTSLDAGAYTYAGATIIINKGVRLSLDTGTYTYTGIDATTKLTRKLLSDAGTYTYTGNALTINKGVMLSLDTGTYTYTGADAAFKLAYKIAGDLGQYVYTGNAATLTYTPTGATYDLEGFRWRNDDGDEDAATWKTTQDVMAYSQLTSPVRLRVLVNAAGDTASAAYQLETRIAGSSDDWEVIA